MGGNECGADGEGKGFPTHRQLPLWKDAQGLTGIQHLKGIGNKAEGFSFPIHPNAAKTLQQKGHEFSLVEQHLSCQKPNGPKGKHDQIQWEVHQ